MNVNYKLRQEDLIKDKEGFFGKVIGINLPVVGQIPVKTKRKKVKNATGLYTCCFLEIENDTTFELRSTFTLDVSICGSALVVLNHMGYDLNDSKSISLAIKDVDKVFEVYKNLIKTNPELFGGKTIEKSSSKNQKDLSRFEKENNMEYQKAKDITIKYGGKVDDFLRDEEISENLLEALYDENIDYWFNNVDKSDLKYSLRYIVKNKNASKILLKKVFEFREKNILEDELHEHYQDLGSDICTYLKDYDWGRKLFKQAKEETFKEEVWSKYERYPTSLAFDVCTKLGDKVWGKELFKEAEKYCKDVYFAEKLSRVFASDDPNWCKEVYISNINDQKNQNVVALCEIGGSIAAHGLNDKVMATESFQKAESMLTYLTDYLMLAGCVLDKDGLNDKKWSRELFQKGLILYCSVDYKEHPNAKDYGFTNEVDYIISCIENDYRYSWNVMKDWLETIETISKKLGSGFSKKDAVIDYLDDDYKEKLNSENSNKNEIDNIKEVKYINYDEVNWVNPPGWEQDAPYVDGRPFTGIVYENYPNGQTSVEDQYTDGIRHGRQTKFYENGYVHWEKIYEYNKFVKWSIKINDTKEDQHKPIIVSDGLIKSKVDNQEEPSVADSSEKTPTEPVESSVNPVEDFRSFLASKYPILKLPKGKKYVEFPIGKGMLVCCMVKTNGVNVYLYSGGKVPAPDVFNKLNELGVSGKVINDKYTITPMPGSRNPNVVRIDLLILYDNRDLNNQDLRNEVLDVYSQLIELCMPLNPDAVVQKETQNNDPNKTSKNKLETAENKSGSLKIVIEGRMHRFKLGILQDELREGLEQVIEYLDDYDTVENLICALWYGKPSEIFEPISKESWDQISSNYPVIEKIQGTSMGGVWEEFWIFYEPWVIDNDNQISIYLNDEILVSGEIGSLFEKTCDPGYKRDNVKEILGIDLTPQEVMGKINCKVSYPFKWDEEIAELMGDKEEFGSEHVWNLSKYGWQLDHIDHSVFKQKIKEVEYGTKRMQVTEYGKYKIISDEIDVENFDWQRLVFLRNSIISDFVPNSKEYALSHVLYAFEDKGLEELFFTIHDFSILDVSYDDNWPTDE